MTTQNNYFVDESGDGILFNRKGAPLFMRDDHLKHFILGMVDLEDEEALKADFDELREKSLNHDSDICIPPLKGRCIKITSQKPAHRLAQNWYLRQKNDFQRTFLSSLRFG